MAHVPLLASGIEPIDAAWGGLYQGGTYLCYGDASGGRGALAMAFLRAGTLLDETGLFISPGRHQDWFIQADTIQFDLRGAYERGLVRLLWIPDVSGLQHLDDRFAVQVLDDLVALIVRERPTRVLINDFTPFLQFRSFEAFRQAFLRTLERLGETDATLLLLLPEPINPVSRQIVDFLRNHLTGSFHLALDTGADGATRRLTLLPGRGHVKHEGVAQWDLMQAGTDDQPAGRESRRVRPGAVKKTRTPLSVAAAKAAFASAPVAGMGHQEDFLEALRQCFASRSRRDTPFILIALRVDARQAVRVPFQELVEHVDRVLRPDDRLLVATDSQRLVLLMPDSHQVDVQSFFDALQGSLGRVHPADQQHLLEQVSVVVVPNGQPFDRAEDFMAYAMEAH